MADTPKQPFPDLEAQRAILQQHLAEFRESNMRATIRLSYLPKFKVGSEVARTSQVSKEVRDLQLQADNARVAILELEPRLTAVEEAIKAEQAAAQQLTP